MNRGAKIQISSHTTSAGLPARGPLLNMNACPTEAFPARAHPGCPGPAIVLSMVTYLLTTIRTLKLPLLGNNQFTFMYLLKTRRTIDNNVINSYWDDEEAAKMPISLHCKRFLHALRKLNGLHTSYEEVLRKDC